MGLVGVEGDLEGCLRLRKEARNESFQPSKGGGGGSKAILSERRSPWDGNEANHCEKAVQQPKPGEVKFNRFLGRFCAPIEFRWEFELMPNLGSLRVGTAS